MIDNMYVSKSFVCLGDSLYTCFDCSYCRLYDEWDKHIRYIDLPNKVNKLFTHLPVAVNLFYGDPMLQPYNTASLLKRLEAAEHKGPVVVITKGDFSRFPDIPFDLDLHFAFSTFGIQDDTLSCNYDGVEYSRLIDNLIIAHNRKYKYKYSIEFRPIIYNINDSIASIDFVMRFASKYGLCVGYSGLQGKPQMVERWGKEGYPFKPYPGFKFGHKKSLSKDVKDKILLSAEKHNVNIFSKTSCLLSYVHNLSRDYNSHYYRPTEVGCLGCAMETKCAIEKSKRDKLEVDTSFIPFDHSVVYKEKHTCILKQKGICEFPTADCSKIKGGLIKINDKITTADVRVIKWLTGYTVDADFYESPYLSDCWSN